MLPGPGSYNTVLDMRQEAKMAKSLLGGAIDPPPPKDDETPGPDAYQQNPIHAIPGFVIKPDSNKVRVEEDKTKEPLGPQRYNPVNPTHKRSDHLTGAGAASIGNAKRSDLVPSLNVPGPGKY